jgi:hypothetical protein
VKRHVRETIRGLLRIVEYDLSELTERVDEIDGRDRETRQLIESLLRVVATQNESIALLTDTVKGGPA